MEQTIRKQGRPKQQLTEEQLIQKKLKKQEYLKNYQRIQRELFPEKFKKEPKEPKVPKVPKEKKIKEPKTTNRQLLLQILESNKVIENKVDELMVRVHKLELNNIEPKTENELETTYDKRELSDEELEVHENEIRELENLFKQKPKDDFKDIITQKLEEKKDENIELNDINTKTIYKSDDEFNNMLNNKLIELENIEKNRQVPKLDKEIYDLVIKNYNLSEFYEMYGIINYLKGGNKTIMIDSLPLDIKKVYMGIYDLKNKRPEITEKEINIIFK